MPLNLPSVNYRRARVCKMSTLRVAVVGAGPAGFYTAQALLRRFPDALVDILEQLPVPFGLVRYGVAPDHPATRRVTAQFSALVRDHPRLSFYGNVHVLFNDEENDGGRGPPKDTVGQEKPECVCVSRAQLDELYHITVRATGAAHPRHLHHDKTVSGVCEKNYVHSAHSFALWLNGHPDFHKGGCHEMEGRALGTMLRAARDITVVGAGNVALDVARLLLRPRNDLLRTDASPSALRALLIAPVAAENENLQAGIVKSVSVLARRAPHEAAWSAAALREVVTKFPGVTARCDLGAVAASLQIVSDRSGGGGVVPLSYGRRALEVLARHAVDLHRQAAVKRSSITLLFNRQVHALRPVLPLDTNVASNDSVGFGESGDNREVGLKLVLRRTDGTASTSGFHASNAVESELEMLRTNGLFLSLGYVSPLPDPRGTRVSVGWANRAHGIISNNKIDAETMMTMMKPPTRPFQKKSGLLGWLHDTQQQVVTWNGWERIHEAERLRGVALGRPPGCHSRIESIREMLQAAQGLPITMSGDDIGVP